MDVTDYYDVHVVWINLSGEDTVFHILRDVNFLGSVFDPDYKRRLICFPVFAYTEAVNYLGSRGGWMRKKEIEAP